MISHLTVVYGTHREAIFSNLFNSVFTIIVLHQICSDWLSIRDVFLSALLELLRKVSVVENTVDTLQELLVEHYI